MHLFRHPLLAEAVAEDVEEHAKRQFRILTALDDIWRFDLVFEAHQSVLAAPEAH